MILANAQAPQVLAALQNMFSDLERLEDREFTDLHRIILDLEADSLDHHLCTYPDTLIDRTDRDGRTALSWAASRRGKAHYVDRLLAAGANPNVAALTGKTPLHYAVESANTEVVDRLLRFAANVHLYSNTYKYTPLHVACITSRSESACLEKLIHAGADTEALSLNGATPLMLAASTDNLVALEVLISAGVSVETQRPGSGTALCHAIEFNNHKTIKFLLKHRASLLTFSDQAQSVLHIAAQYGNQRTLRILALARIKGLRIDHRDTKGLTPLDYANKHKDQSPTWHATFADLLASIDPKPLLKARPVASPMVRKQTRINVLVVILAVSVRIQRILREIRQIWIYLVQLPRPLAALLCSLVACLTIAWCFSRQV